MENDCSGAASSLSRPMTVMDVNDMLISSDDLASLADTMCSPTPPASHSQLNSVSEVVQLDQSPLGHGGNRSWKNGSEEDAWLAEQEAVMRILQDIEIRRRLNEHRGIHDGSRQIHEFMLSKALCSDNSDYSDLRDQTTFGNILNQEGTIESKPERSTLMMRIYKWARYLGLRWKQRVRHQNMFVFAEMLMSAV